MFYNGQFYNAEDVKKEMMFSDLKNTIVNKLENNNIKIDEQGAFENLAFIHFFYKDKVYNIYLSKNPRKFEFQINWTINKDYYDLKKSFVDTEYSVDIKEETLYNNLNKEINSFLQILN